MTDASSPPKLLFVDDELGILSALRRLFRPHGYQVFIAESGAEGLEIIEKEGIDLVVSDMRMPEMDGAEFLKRVKATSPDTTRILLTGYADVASTIAAINEGEIYRYIAKPWDDREIVITVEQALEHRRLQRENEQLSAVVRAQNDELKLLNSGLEQKVIERTSELQHALKLFESAHNELKKSFLMTVQVFSGLIELRVGQSSAGLSGHGRRVGEQAQLLAKRMGLNEKVTQAVMLAGLLHDIGKLGLPDSLLDKPFNNLTGEHRALVMKHPVIGQNILMGIAKLKEAAVLVRHHHELYDGSGFPDQLSGIAIPQGSRILAVVNDYDALQIGTLVQKPLKPSAAIDFLVENKGKRYDPAVVDAFVLLLAETQKSVISDVPLRTMHLKSGMVLSRDLLHRDGYVLLAKGNALNDDIISQLVRMESTDAEHMTVFVQQDTH